MSVRDYGLPFPARPEGPPRIKGLLTEVGGSEAICPHCDCRSLADVEVSLVDVQAPGMPSRATGAYLGCPACPWASPMVIVAKAQATAQADQGDQS